MIDVKGMSKNAMPETFTDKMKWIYWKVKLIHFLKYQTSIHVFHINYAVHNNSNPILRNNPNCLYDYADRT